MLSLSFTDDKSVWDNFLHSHQEINHHAYSWHWRDIFKKTFGHQSYYLICKDNTANALTAALPLYMINSKLFGKSLISVPYLNAGGILAEDQTSFDKILFRANELAKELDVKYIELRNQHTEKFFRVNSLRKHKVSMLLELNSDPELMFSKFPPKLRSQIRRPSKSGMYAEVATGNNFTAKQLAAFYQVFSEHMRDLGTPVYPKSLFKNALEAFKEKAKLIVIWSGSTPVAAGITLGYGNTTEIPWASALKRYNSYSPNMLLYWEAIKAACIDNYKFYDFGRSSPESGTFKFKQQWGANPFTLNWYYQLHKGEVPDVNPNNPKYNFLVSCWRKMPLGLANCLGPILTRGIP